MFLQKKRSVMKKLYKENRTLFILIIVALSCILISLILLFKYFYFGNGASKYGDRLDGIENVEISTDLENKVKDNINSNKMVSNSSINIAGKIVYIKITFNETASL